VKPSIRIKSIGTKVSEEQFSALESHAHARNLTLSEWVRAELLKTNDGSVTVPGEVLLAEILASRTILINLVYSISKGESITAEAMQELIRRTDETKARRALELLVETDPRNSTGHSARTDAEHEREN
jgi:hypothetical protein